MPTPPSTVAINPPISSPLAFPDFLRLWSARGLASLAEQSESVTIGWQVYSVARQTRGVDESAFLVGMVGLAQFLSRFVLTLPAGMAADRGDRRSILLLCLATELACAVALAAVATRPLPSLPAIFAIAVVFGAARAFLSPALSATGPMLVSREALPRAISLSSIAWQAGSVLGPWLGGVLCALATTAAYAGSALLYAGAWLAIWAIASPTRPDRQPGSRLAQVREGLAYVWSNKIVLGAISLDLFAVLLGGATALLPVYARDVLKVGADGFGLLRSGPALGAMAMAYSLSRRPIARHAGRWMFLGVATFGAATLVFAVSHSLPLSLGALAVLGAADMISVFVRQSLVQLTTPDAMRGRVAAVSSLFIGASNELGEFETGVVARSLGPVGAALFGGVGSLLVTLAWAGMFPDLRKADRLDGTRN